jgi:hypothetical protein
MGSAADIVPEHGLECLIGPLSLAIRLRVVGGGEFVLGSQDPGEFREHLAGENRASICDQIFWYAMVAKDVVVQQLCCAL